MTIHLPMYICRRFCGEHAPLDLGYVADKHSMTVRLLTSELVKDGVFNKEIFEQICRAFDGGAILILTTERG